MQGSLLLDFKGLSYILRVRQRITADVERVQKASMGTGAAQLCCKTQSRKSQQGKSVEDICRWYFCPEISPVDASLCIISHKETSSHTRDS
jgi:hypothetical protein